jgi:6,7-dimethyl-8-ribityllumazine synthase
MDRINQNGSITVFNIGNNVKTTEEYNSNILKTKLPIINGIITAFKTIDYYNIAMVKEGNKKARSINIKWLEVIK